MARGADDLKISKSVISACKPWSNVVYVSLRARRATEIAAPALLRPNDLTLVLRQLLPVDCRFADLSKGPVSEGR